MDKYFKKMWVIVAFELLIIITIIVCFSGCVEEVKTHTHVCAGVLDKVFTDGTMASLTLSNGTISRITFYPHHNERYECFDFELLEIGAMYTFVFHLEDNVARPGIEMYYIDNAPVIDEINRGNHVEYWIKLRGSIQW